RCAAVALLHAGIAQRGFRRAALPIGVVEFRLFERRAAIVLYALDAGTVADRVRAVLEALDPPYVQPDRGVELQRPTTGRRLRAVVHHDTIDEVVVVALHLDVEPVHRTGLRLHVDVEDPSGYRAQLGGGENRLDSALALVAREQLVGHRVGDVW